MTYENIKVEVETHRARNSRKDKISLHAWLLYKDKPYPLNFIGGGVVTISQALGITEREVEKLYVEKLSELLPTVEDEKLKIAVEERIKKLLHTPPEWKKPRICVGCSKSYIPSHRRQFYCSGLCREETRVKRQARRINERKARKHGKQRTNIRTFTIKGVDNPACPYCNGPTFKKGTQSRNGEEIQRYKCYSCRKSFLENYATKRGPHKND